MITAETLGEKMGKPKNWKRRTKILLWTSIVLAIVALGTTIGWLNSYTPMATDVTSLATAISAAATLGLALFASLAWTSSKDQLALMKADFEAAEERALQAIMASSNLETQRDMNSALFGYLSAYADLFAASARTMTELQVAQVELRKSSIRFIMIHEFPGRSGEITNFDDLMMLIAEARVQARAHEIEGVTARELAFGLQQGFNMVSNELRDLYQGRVNGRDLYAAFRAEFVELANTYSLELPKKYIDTARSRGWLDNDV